MEGNVSENRPAGSRTSEPCAQGRIIQELKNVANEKSSGGDKYSKLAGNTIIFAISSFSSKLLTKSEAKRS